ncbi:type IV secretion system protein VirB10 (plasmid) [Asticcacaulis sp. DW145]|uniref:type IV secretion system protein VirB10 n=1 Tax=Asticcacaulis sp. DW145 TaxID=3095608 RepID=UPI00308FECB8|nr:type IV secretion system protein VirB10 [Asticcacaulis sp. DW145]
MDTHGNPVGGAAPQPEASPPELNRIVSVNNRGGASSNIVGKVVFAIAVIAVLTIGGLVTFKRFNADAATRKAEAEAAAKSENKPATVAGRRQFGADGVPTVPASASANGQDVVIGVAPSCADGTPGTIARTPDGQPMLNGQGQPMRFCGDGKMIVPALDTTANAPPIPVSGTQGHATAGQTQTSPKPYVDRYGGDVILSGNSRPERGAGQTDAGDPMNNPFIRAALEGGQAPQRSQTAATTGPAGSVGSLLQPSVAQAVRAAKIGDRNMILPMGRSIECGLSVKIISDLAGLTSCVLTQNVYSDNGRVVLLERGSEATGEYRSVSERGQRRLFVIWTRIKTPNGVVINLDSPGSDSLGTTGLPGLVDNHWWERVGGAFLLSTIKDAIAYKTAEASSGTAGGVVYQNTAAAGDRMAEKVLDSTINIRPTIYKNQGDRGSIYVARDLDFGRVYGLRAQ